MNLIETWISDNYFVLFAAGLGFIAIYLQIRQNVWYWLVSIIMVSMYIFIYINAKLYADMSLQVYFLVISFYGWYMWLFGNKQNHQRSELKVSSTTIKMIGILILITLFLFVFIA